MLNFAWLSGTGGQLTESPVWDAENNALLWCDIPAGSIHELRLADNARRSWALPGPVGSFGLAAGDDLVVGCRTEILRLDRVSGAVSLIARLADEPGGGRTRANDGKVGPDGAFWIGTMDDTPAKQPVGALYRVRPDGVVERRLEGLITSNGLAWSADGRTMFHSDSRARQLRAYDFDPASGRMGAGRLLAAPDDATGRPDGGATDIAGTYWSAGVTGGRLNEVTLAAGLHRGHDFPVPGPTMPCFGGPDMRTMFVTSLRHGVNDTPLCGALFFARVEVPGVKLTRFGS